MGNSTLRGVTASSGFVSSTSFSGSIIDSVDGDDGDSSNGICPNCDSYFSSSGPTDLIFTFEGGLGLPTQAGIVWTDGEGSTTFEAFDEKGDSLGSIGPVNISDNSVYGTTAEDHFFGVIYEGGISAIKISNTSSWMEIDHLQYGKHTFDVPVQLPNDPVTGGGGDPPPPDPPPKHESDLIISKKASPRNEVVLGKEVKYTIRVFNNGPESASVVRVSESLPSDVTVVSITTTQGTCNETDGIIVCDLGILNEGDEVIITIIVRPTKIGKVFNRVTVSHVGTDPEPGNNSAAWEVSVIPIPIADLSIQKTADSPYINPDGTTTFFLTVENNGPDTAVGVVVTDSLPDGIGLVSFSTNKGSCAAQTNSDGETTVTCNIDSLAPGETVIITVVITHGYSEIHNIAYVTHSGIDYIFRNNSDAKSVIFSPPPSDTPTPTYAPTPTHTPTPTLLILIVITPTHTPTPTPTLYVPPLIPATVPVIINP